MRPFGGILLRFKFYGQQIGSQIGSDLTSISLATNLLRCAAVQGVEFEDGEADVGVDDLVAHEIPFGISRRGPPVRQAQAVHRRAVEAAGADN